jgi:8-oxo-dGTP pyrophosphatase MutT (NUDIX family)
MNTTSTKQLSAPQRAKIAALGQIMLPETKAKQEPESVAVFLTLGWTTFLSQRSATEKGFPNCWQNPGGKKEQGESALFAAMREVREETGLVLEPYRFFAINRKKLPNYYLTSYYVTLNPVEARLIKNVEPDKNGEWKQFTFQELHALAETVPALKENARQLFYILQAEQL